MDVLLRGVLWQGGFFCSFARKKFSVISVIRNIFGLTDEARARESPACGPDSRTAYQSSRRFGGQHSSCAGRDFRSLGIPKRAFRHLRQFEFRRHSRRPGNNQTWYSALRT